VRLEIPLVKTRKHKSVASDKHTRAFSLWTTSSFGMGLSRGRQCEWLDCDQRRERGSYCATHAEQIYAGYGGKISE
jgi:hypothetical protein